MAAGLTRRRARALAGSCSRARHRWRATRPTTPPPIPSPRPPGHCGQRERGPDREADALVIREASLAAAARRDIAVLRSRDRGNDLACTQPKSRLADAYQIAMTRSFDGRRTGLGMDMVAGGSSPFWAQAAGQGAKNPSACGFRPMASEPTGFPVAAFPPGHTAETIDPDAPGPQFCGHHRLCARSGDDAALHVALVHHRAPLRLSFAKLPERRKSLSTREFGNFRKAAELGATIANSAISPATFGRGATMYRAYYLGLIWSLPMVALRNNRCQIFDVAISEGDVVYAQQAVRNYTRMAWRSEPTLDGVSGNPQGCRSREPNNWVMRSASRACARSLETIKIFKNPAWLRSSGR